MRRGVRQTRIGCAFRRWYAPGTGRYTKLDPAFRPLSSWPYLYGKSNPLFHYDPLGLHETSFPHGGPNHYMTPPGNDFECVAKIRDQVRREADGQTRYQHCLANCLITKRCPGGKTIAMIASFVKEAGDLGRCLVQRREGNCKSAFQPADFTDNKRGRQCEPEIPCHEQCGPLRIEAEPPPGPFGALSPGGDSSDGSSGSS